MALTIPRGLITKEYAKMIQRHLTLRPKPTFGPKSSYNTTPPIIFFEANTNTVTLPYFYGRKMASMLNFNASNEYPQRKYEFGQKLYAIQEEVVQESLEHLNKFKTTTLNLYTSFGKTVVASYLASKLNRLTLVIYHRDILKSQWESTFRDFTSARIYINGQRFTKIEDYDIILSMDTKVPSIPTDLRSQIGTMIVDEAHSLCTPSRVSMFLGIRPEYIIAATATLKRADGIESMIQFMCGNHKVERISYKPFQVYKLNTGTKFPIPQNSRGKADWNQIVSTLIQDVQRNELIYEIVKTNPDYKILILTWRKNHVDQLYKELLARKEQVDYMAGTKKSYKDSRILIGTIAKIGTGFDEKAACATFSGFRINLLIFAGTMKSETLIEQTSGRAFRAGNPNIIMLVDDLLITKNHWRIAKKWYISRNGTIHE